METKILEVKNLKKYFKVPGGFLHAVDDVSFSIPEKCTLGVVGESGCGKSTLGRTLLRLTDATEGEILFQGEDICKYNKKQMLGLRSEMQMIFQDPYSSLNPHMTVEDLIAEPLRVSRRCKNKQEIYRKVDEIMDTVGLAARLARAYPHELDGGRRQRIGVARALILDPKFIVCDEPVSALDVSIQAQILNLLMDLQEERGLTYMFITHNLSVVKHISDKIMVMYLGKCVEMADKEELFKNPLHPYTKALLSAIPVPDLSMRDKEAQTIKGELTSPVNPAPGCRFAPRCPYASDGCTKADLPLSEVSPGHFTACPF
ncbi:MAG: ABC transporter ATP-binding protein [Anaerovoracaceae bacterium]